MRWIFAYKTPLATTLWLSCTGLTRSRRSYSVAYITVIEYIIGQIPKNSTMEWHFHSSLKYLTSPALAILESHMRWWSNTFLKLNASRIAWRFIILFARSLTKKTVGIKSPCRCRACGLCLWKRLWKARIRCTSLTCSIHRRKICVGTVCWWHGKLAHLNTD